jgi:hypothetical protein
MRKLIYIILLLLIATPLFGQSTVIVAKKKAATCSVSTNELGTRTQGGLNSYAGENKLECNLWTPDCSGKLYTAYLEHRGTGTDYAKVCVYTDDGDSTPDAGDSLLVCSGVITGNENEVWESAAMDTNPDVSTGTSYWLCMIGDNSAWNYFYAASGLARKDITIAGAYASPPSDLTGSWNNSANYQLSVYVTVGD